MCVCGLISLLAVGWVLSVTNAAPTFGMSSFSLRFQLTTVQFCHYGQFEHYRDSCDHTWYRFPSSATQATSVLCATQSTFCSNCSTLRDSLVDSTLPATSATRFLSCGTPRSIHGSLWEVLRNYFLQKIYCNEKKFHLTEFKKRQIVLDRCMLQPVNFLYPTIRFSACSRVPSNELKSRLDVKWAWNQFDIMKWLKMPDSDITWSRVFW